MAMVLAIDPGSTESAYVLIGAEYRPVQCGKLDNEQCLSLIGDLLRRDMFDGELTDFVVEMVACYGMPVGAEVFETAFWIGRFWEAAAGYRSRGRIYRQEEKLNLCHSARANDSTIRQALIDRFAPGQMNCGKGTGKRPGWFWGFKADIWQAYAVGVTWLDKQKGGGDNEP